MQSEPESSELEVSTIAGDRAEDLESGKVEGGPREGSEDAGPRERKFSYVHWAPSFLATFSVCQ